jgi:hypothetical protein
VEAVTKARLLYFQAKNHNLGKFWKVLNWKMFVNYMVIWSILQPLGIFYSLLCIFSSFGTFSPLFGMLYLEKSGNPVWQ